MALVASPIDAQSVANALSEIAEIASETLELQDVFDRVAAAIRELVPLDIHAPWRGLVGRLSTASIHRGASRGSQADRGLAGFGRGALAHLGYRSPAQRAARPY